MHIVYWIKGVDLLMHVDIKVNSELLKNLKRSDNMDWKSIKGTCREVFLYFLLI